MQIYQTKAKKIYGAGYDRVLRDAMAVLDEIKKSKQELDNKAELDTSGSKIDKNNPQPTFVWKKL